MAISQISEIWIKNPRARDFYSDCRDYQRLQLRISSSLVIVLSALVSGCGDAIPTVPVQGRVMWQGKPLTDGTVVFQPREIAKGLPRRPATGQVGKDGSYQLTSFEKGDGAVPGEYLVTIFSYSSEPSDSDDDLNVGRYVWAIPERFGDPSRSGLTATVADGADVEECNFDLK
ncbi:hypothetical protein OAS39_03805 [Pirellulales bacterium]|nr:hypothetical protein [Pirellulales bacterium]